MNRGAVLAIARRDLRVVRRNTGVVAPMLIVPVVLVLVTALATYLISRSGSALDDMGPILQAIPAGMLGDDSLPLELRLAVIMATYVVPPVLVIVPLLVASILATDSVAGERERGTIEGLLLTPVSERDVLIGKLCGALVPALVLGVLTHLAYAAIVDVLLWTRLDGPVLPTVPWMVTVLWFGPAFTTAALGAIVLVSARAHTVQSAYQLSGLCVLPLVLLTIGQASGIVLLQWWIGLLAGAVLWAVAVLLMSLGGRALRREPQLTSLT